MKTLENIFGSKNTNKTINNFSDQLNFNTMLMIKGGEGDSDNDHWPPPVVTGNGSNTNN